MKEVGTFHTDYGGNQLPCAWLTNVNEWAELSWLTPQHKTRNRFPCEIQLNFQLHTIRTNGEKWNKFKHRALRNNHKQYFHTAHQTIFCNNHLQCQKKVKNDNVLQSSNCSLLSKDYKYSVDYQLPIKQQFIDKSEQLLIFCRLINSSSSIYMRQLWLRR